MKETFAPFFGMSDDNFENLWEECTFVFDASALLNLYRYPETERKDIFKSLDLISDRLWLPHQAGEEYFRKREQKIEEQHIAYQELTQLLKTTTRELETLEEKKYYPHPDDNLVQHIKNLRDTLKVTLQQLDDLKKEKTGLVSNGNDLILNTLNELFPDDKIGRPYSFSRKQELYIESNRRKAMKIPPGFEDRDGHGDFLIWMQILEYALETRKPIIFISDDGKKDWVINNDPRKELQQEIYDETGVRFWIYNSKQFLKEGKRRGYLKVRTKTIKTSEQVIELSKVTPQSRTSGLTSDAIGSLVGLATFQNEFEQLNRSMAGSALTSMNARAFESSLANITGRVGMDSEIYKIATGINHSPAFGKTLAEMALAHRSLRENLAPQLAEMALAHRSLRENLAPQLAEMALAHRSLRESLAPQLADMALAHHSLQENFASQLAEIGRIANEAGRAYRPIIRDLERMGYFEQSIEDDDISDEDKDDNPDDMNGESEI